MRINRRLPKSQAAAGVTPDEIVGVDAVAAEAAVVAARFPVLRLNLLCLLQVD